MDLDSLRHRVHETLEVDAPDDPRSRAFDIMLSALILANLVALALGTVESIEARYSAALQAFEVVSVVLFTIEYIARLWSVVEEPRYSSPLIGRLRWSLTPYAIADLLAIVPFYIGLGGIDLRFLRVLRLLRLARVIKLGRYSEGLQALGGVLWARRAVILSSSVVLLVLLTLGSGLLYYAEHDVQPERFPNLPASMYWAFKVMVGEIGDTAVTPFGKLVVAFIALLGVGLFALPAGILASGLVEVLRRQNGGDTSTSAFGDGQQRAEASAEEESSP